MFIQFQSASNLDIFNCEPRSLLWRVAKTVTQHTITSECMQVSPGFLLKNSWMITMTKNSGNNCICIDLWYLNKALKQKWYQLSTIDKVLSRLMNVNYFIKLDVGSPYLYIVLYNGSSYLTVFQAGFGWYHLLQLPFRNCVCSKIFQKHHHLIIDGLHIIACIANDIIRCGSGNELEASRDCDITLKLLLHQYCE